MFIVPITQMPGVNSLSKISESSVGAEGKSNLPFSDILKEAIDNVKETQAIAKQDAYDLAMGTADNLSEIMINSAKAATAIELSVQLTTRAVNAYKEIMQMQV